MSCPRNTAKILLIGEDPVLQAALNDAGFAVVRVHEGTDLYQAAEQYRPVAVLLRADSPSRDTLEHLAMLSRKFPQPAVLLHKGDDAQLGEFALELGISAYVAEGMSAPVVRALVEVSISQRRQLEKLRLELSRSQQTLAKRKLVDAAKCALMERHAIRETEAYALLKSTAMRARQNLEDRAREILQGAIK
ncbi:MAG: ANTAR domain-containing response regulator [Oceanococcus sp.]